MNTHKVLMSYVDGQRDFSHRSLCGLSFINEDLSGVDFSYTRLIGSSFLGCRLDHAKFIGCKTGQPVHIKLATILLCICIVVLSTFFAAFFSVYASSTTISESVLIFTSFLLYCSLSMEPLLGHQSFTNRLPFSIKALFALIFMILIFSEFRIQSTNDGLSFLFSFSFLFFSMLMQVVGNSFSRTLAYFFGESTSKPRSRTIIDKFLILACFATACSSYLVIYSAPNQIAIATNIAFTIFTVLAAILPVFDSISKVITAHLARLYSIGNTSFKGSSLISTDFSFASLAGVDFRGASLESVCWSNTQDFELACFGNVIPRRIQTQSIDPSPTGASMPTTPCPSWPSALVQAKRMSKLVPFVGAGLSLGPDVKGGFPAWRELPGRLLDSCDLYEVWHNEDDRKTLRERFFERDPADPARILPRALPLREMLRQLDLVKDKLGDNYANALTSIFRPVDAKPGAAHAAIVALNAPLVITTNFDKLIEAADQSSERTMYTGKKAYAAQADIRQNRSVLFKVHGTAEDIDSVVLTLDEYGSAHADQAYKTVMNYLLMDRTFLFVGYGMADPQDLDLVLSNICNLLKGATGPHFALLKCLTDAQHDVDRNDRLRREYNVNTITFKDYVELVPLLEMLASF
jgi:hypothetical protein